jgi:hypothetical protein
MVAAAPGKRDLAGVAAEVGATLGEHDARALRIAVDRHQHGRFG